MNNQDTQLIWEQYTQLNEFSGCDIAPEPPDKFRERRTKYFKDRDGRVDPNTIQKEEEFMARLRSTEGPARRKKYEGNEDFRMSRYSSDNLDDEINTGDQVEIASDHTVHPGKIGTIISTSHPGGAGEDVFLVQLDNGHKTIINRHYIAKT